MPRSGSDVTVAQYRPVRSVYKESMVEFADFA